MTAALATGEVYRKRKRKRKQFLTPLRSRFASFYLSPTIVLSAGVEYTFEQHEQNNWMHPIGFSYVAGGAHTECLKDVGENTKICAKVEEHPSSNPVLRLLTASLIAATATSAGSCYLHGSDGVMQLLCDTDELQCDDFSGTYYSPGYVSQR